MTYDYVDEKGQVLYQIVRKSNKQFPVRRPDGDGGWQSGLGGAQRVLYRLPEVLARSGEPVFVAEGEKDADRLHKEGLLATTNPFGAGTWRQEYSDVLLGRDVIVLVDNDEPGKNHAKGVASSLSGKAESLKVLELPGLSEHGDVSDWLNDGHTVAELQELVEAAPSWAPPSEASSPPGTPPTDGTGQRANTLAGQLVEAVESQGVELFHDERGEPYAAIPQETGRRVLPVRSKEFATWLSGLAWSGMDTAASSEMLNSARNVLASKACFDCQLHELHVRCAWLDGIIWIDLDGIRAVRVGP